MSKNMRDKDRDQIITMASAFGMSNREIAEKMGFHPAAISLVRLCVEHVKQDNWEFIAERAKKGGWGLSMIEWAANRMGKTVPQIVYDASAARRANERAEEEPQPEQKEPQQTPDPNASVAMFKVLEMMMETLKTNKAILDAISALAADLKDNVNANCDVLSQRLGEIGQNVECIKNNTRKRGL